MTHEDDDQPSREDAARLRITEIAALFAEMRATLVKWLRDAGPAADATPKQMMTKISELQTAHLLVARAEEVFHDKFGTGEVANGIDYDVARDDIGRELDRLRAAVEAKLVFEGPDNEPD
jgi:hypothetical protein